jgi:hypothetical protein
MMDDLGESEYLGRFDARTFDPNEWIKIDGVMYRAGHVDEVRAALRKRRDKRYYAKNQTSVRARSAAWKAANPEKVITQRGRSWDRNYHRPMIGIDMEGEDFKGDNKFDKAGNVYPLHRVTLCGAGGWQRLHSSTDLANGVGLPTLGKECPSYFLARQTNGSSLARGPTDHETRPRGESSRRRSFRRHDRPCAHAGTAAASWRRLSRRRRQKTVARRVFVTSWLATPVIDFSKSALLHKGKAGVTVQFLDEVDMVTPGDGGDTPHIANAFVFLQ